LGANSRGPAKDETITEDNLKETTAKSTEIIGSNEI
jgi:hypothetical protein